MPRNHRKARHASQGGNFKGAKLRAELAGDRASKENELVRAGHACTQPLLCQLSAATCKTMYGPKEERVPARTGWGYWDW